MTHLQIKGLIVALERVLQYYGGRHTMPNAMYEYNRALDTLEHWEECMADLMEEERILLYTIGALP